MADQDCQNACVAAYTAHVANCADVLRDNLLTATTDAEKQLAKERFANCMALAKETKTLCLGTCDD